MNRLKNNLIMAGNKLIRAFLPKKEPSLIETACFNYIPDKKNGKKINWLETADFSENFK